MGIFVDARKELAAAKAKDAVDNPQKWSRTEDSAVTTTSTNMSPYAVEFNAQRHPMERSTSDMACIITIVEQ